MKNKKKISFISITLLIVITLIPTFVIASSPIDNPDDYNPNNSQIPNRLAEIAKEILNVISIVGIVVGVVTLMIIGIKYMVGTVQEKAEYKKTMLMYLVGAVLLTSICGIVKIIYNLTTDITSEIVEPSQMTGGGGQSSGHGAGRRTSTTPGD